MPEVIISASGPQYGLVINPDGSINANVSGVDISIGSLALSLENIYITSGNNLHLGSAWTNIGSVLISNDLGSTAYIIGSVAITNMGSILFGGGVGSVMISGTSQPVWRGIGSVMIGAGVGSVVISGTSIPPFRGIGSVYITNSYLGSETYVTILSGTQYADIMNRVAGSIVNMPIVGVSGQVGISGIIGATVGSVALYDLGSTAWVVGSVAITNIGSFYFAGGTGSVMISGTSIPVWRGIGSVLPTGIGSVYVVDINNDNGIVDVGSPSFKRGLLTASGTYINVWPIDGVGSRLEMHGFHISTNSAGYVSLCRSGTIPVVISDWNLNYTSGATIEKTFVNPIIPNGANVPVGIGATIAGSTICTIYGREVK